MAGFLVPFLAGGITKALETRDEYDENAGNMVDAASAKYSAQFDLNQKAIELQNANYKAVSGSLGLAMAEIAAKDGNLNDVPTNQVIAFVKGKYSKAFRANLEDRTKEKDDKGNLTFKLSDLGYQTLFSQDYKTATDSLEENREWAANNLNKGAVKNLTDLYLAKGKELPEPTGLEKAQKFMFGDRVTEGTGVGFEQAVAEKIGDEITVQPKEFKTTSTIKERLGFTEPVNIGTVHEQNKAIADLLNIKDIRIVEGGIVFPVRFRNEVLAIKEEARKYALEFTTMKGGTEVVNVSGLMQKAHDELSKEIIAPIADRFTGYMLDPREFTKNMTYRMMKASGIDTDSTWYTENNFTEKDFVSGKIAKSKKVDAVAKRGEEIINTITVSRNVADIMEKEIQNLDSMATMKLYVDYLPDNLRINIKGVSVPLKVYYKNIFALISH
jgi:hypothetical protein